jgi:hypothetical protein
MTIENQKQYCQLCFITSNHLRVESKAAPMRVGHTDLGVKTYVSPRERPLTHEEARVREIAFALKDPQPWAVEEAVRAMRPFIKGTDVLVPIPNSLGNTQANLALCRALSNATGASVLDLLSRKSRVPSSHQNRQKGVEGLPPTEHLMAGSLPEGLHPNRIVFIDNVVTTGSTFHAARMQIGGGRGLAYAKANEVLRIASKVVYRYLNI